ncbi:LytTR family transcriptional regulator [Gramella sp. BOM4]|nr:LytTR family transcriptional regulator [Christiangramia bathymodioli]
MANNFSLIDLKFIFVSHMNTMTDIVIFSKDKTFCDNFIKFLDNTLFSITKTVSSEEEIMVLLFDKLPDLIIIDFDNELKPTNFKNSLHEYFPDLPKFIGVSKNKVNAYEALKSGFIDFFLKPLIQLEVSKFQARFFKNKSINKNKVDSLCIKSNSDYRFLDLNEILFLQADNNSTDIFMSNGQKICAFQTLKYFEKCLPSFFLRIHNSYVINTKIVKRINFGKSKVTIEQQGIFHRLPFSRTYRKDVESLRENLLENQLLTASN